MSQLRRADDLGVLRRYCGKDYWKAALWCTLSSDLMLDFALLPLRSCLTYLVPLWRFRKTKVNTSGTFECSGNDVMVAAAGVAASQLLEQCTQWLDRACTDPGFIDFMEP